MSCKKSCLLAALFKGGRKMKYTYTVMTQEEAEEIAYNWHYEGNIPFTI